MLSMFVVLSEVEYGKRLDYRIFFGLRLSRDIGF